MAGLTDLDFDEVERRWLAAHRELVPFFRALADRSARARRPRVRTLIDLGGECRAVGEPAPREETDE